MTAQKMKNLEIKIELKKSSIRMLERNVRYFQKTLDDRRVALQALEAEKEELGK